MQIGIDSFVETIVGSGRSPGELDAERIRELLEEFELADRVGVNVYGIGEHHREEYIASSTEILGPAYATTSGRIGRERGWPPTTRTAFDAQRGGLGAFFVGDPDRVAQKMWQVSDALGGVSRITLMMSGGPLPHSRMLRGIELLGSDVGPSVREMTASTIQL
jgi:alkanesulfonate monooxygenase SsuD/methylene tetrahydromethanopterin reductase-like flavin-dependent oxidoreductase (luciferase family)